MAVTLIVQDDDGTTANANAYIDTTDMLSYWDNHGVDYSSQADDSLKVSIIRGTEYIDQRFDYNGLPLAEGQTTQFPRSSLYDCRGDLVEGVPQVVKNACAEYAGRYIDNSQLQSDITDVDGLAGRVTKEKLGPMEIQYAEGISAGGQYPSYPTADQILESSCFVVYGNQVGRAW
jgi:hypothetical protein